MSLVATVALGVLAFGKKSSAITDKNAVATITEMENDSVKADTAGDSSYVKKNYADNFHRRIELGELGNETIDSGGYERYKHQGEQ